MLMNSSNTLEIKVAGPQTASAYAGSLLTFSLCLFSLTWPKSLHNKKIYHKCLFPLSISTAMVSVISENIILSYTFILKMSFGQKGIKCECN